MIHGYGYGYGCTRGVSLVRLRRRLARPGGGGKGRNTITMMPEGKEYCRSTLRHEKQPPQRNGNADAKHATQSV